MMVPSPVALQLKAGDEIAVALRDIAAGEALSPFGLVAATAVPFGHKISLRPLGPGDVIHRLGQPIGIATAAIPAGAHVHLDNMGFEQSMAAHAVGTRLSNAMRLATAEIPAFEGYLRADGRVATRNYVGVLTTVNCS